MLYFNLCISKLYVKVRESGIEGSLEIWSLFGADRAAKGTGNKWQISCAVSWGSTTTWDFVSKLGFCVLYLYSYYRNRVEVLRFELSLQTVFSSCIVPMNSVIIMKGFARSWGSDSDIINTITSYKKMELSFLLRFCLLYCSTYWYSFHI